MYEVLFILFFCCCFFLWILLHGKRRRRINTTSKSQMDRRTKTNKHKWFLQRYVFIDECRPVMRVSIFFLRYFKQSIWVLMIQCVALFAAFYSNVNTIASNDFDSIFIIIFFINTNQRNSSFALSIWTFLSFENIHGHHRSTENKSLH